MSNESKNISAAWQKRSPWLARWAITRMVSRTDIWQRYLPVEKRKPGADGEPVICRAAPIKKKRGILQLSEKALIKHFRGEDPGHIIGVHSADTHHYSKWMAVDLDRHNRQITPLDNLRAATHWKDELIAMGFHPLLLDTDGVGGYHLLVLFREAAPTGKVFDFISKLVRDHGDFGLEQPPRILPGSSVADAGDWLRLPGRHPLADYWTRVWNGHQWLEGADAVESLLGTHGDSAALIRKTVASDNAIPLHQEHEATPVENDGRAEQEVLAYLLAATRSGDELTAFTSVHAAHLTGEAFETPTHREIFEALERLTGTGEHITPTDIAEEIPDEHRGPALAAIDELILLRPVDCRVFERRLAKLSKRDIHVVHEDSNGELDEIVRAWPRLDPDLRRAIATMIRAMK